MKVKVQLNRSTKMADYQYYKTGVELEEEIADDSMFDQAYEALYNKADAMLNTTIAKERLIRVTEEQIGYVDEAIEECMHSADPKTAMVKAALEKVREDILNGNPLDNLILANTLPKTRL